MIVLLLALTQKSQAQLYPLGAIYFDNEYLANPAMAGHEEGMNLDLSFRKQWTEVPGSPLRQNITGEYGFNKIGLGLNITNESEGLLHSTRIAGTYAYHLPIANDKDQLNFGLSAAFLEQHIANNDIIGDQGDAAVGRYNNRRSYFDGDFGIAYTSDRLSIQAAVPNMKNFFRKDFDRIADLAIFYSAVSYKMNLGTKSNAMGLEPKVAFRGVKGFDNIVDAGANLSFSDKLNLMTMYHSTGSTTFGFGFNYNKKLRIASNYTSASSSLKGYTTTGDFEINIKLSF